MQIEYMTTDMTSDAEDDGRVTIEYDEFLRMMTHMILNRNPGMVAQAKAFGRRRV